MNWLECARRELCPTGRRLYVSRHLGELSEDEFQALCDRFADEVLAPLNVAGSLALTYSLYTALDREYRRAKRAVREGTRGNDIPLASQP
jgi:hypothetical protein